MINAFYVIEKLLELSECGKTLQDFFTDNDIKKIAIYGYGKIGHHFYEAIKKTDVEVIAIFDKRAYEIKNMLNIPIYVPDRMCTISESADLIVITPIDSYYEIKEYYEDKISTDMVSACEIVTYCYEGKDIMRPPHLLNNSVYVEVGRRAPHELVKGKHILVTGGGGGIGYCIAESLAENGAKVVVLGRDQKKLKIAADRINDNIGDLRVWSLQWDITDYSNLGLVKDRCVDLMGEIDGLVNAAGIYKSEDYKNISEDEFDVLININFKGTYFLTNSICRYMKKNKIEGNIVTITSEAGGCAYTGMYALTKNMLNTYIQGLAFQLSSCGIRSNGIAPGDVATDMTGYDKEGNLYADNIAGRIIRPEEIAEVALFLMSDLSICINGQIIYCNNGETIPVENYRSN